LPDLKTDNGLSWFYEVEGNGEPLLFIHGWGVDRRIWRQQSKNFSQYFKVITVDLPGHGKSSWKVLTLEEIAGDIYKILEELKLFQINIIGSSFGGLVALKIYHMYPRGVKRLILVGTHPKFLKSDDYPFGIDIKYIRKLANQLQTNYPSIVHIFFRSLFTKAERESRRFRWIQTFRRTESVPGKTALLELLYILEKEDMREVMESIDIPLQFIYGVEDYICHKRLHDYLMKRFPQARFDLFDQCGHFPFLSQPYGFNKVLEEFLDQ